jgi:hypothetical protein
VFFLAGNLGGKTTRSCTVPCGKFLFFPVVAQLKSAPAGCSGCDDCLNGVRAAIDAPSVLECEIDGVPVPQLGNHREAPAACFDLQLPADNILGLPAGKTGPCAVDGFWLMLEPLAPGKHTIRTRAVLGPPGSPAFDSQVTFDLTVAPPLYPPHSTVEGKTIGEWSSEWWKRVLSIPTDRNPLLDPDGHLCHEGQGGPVFFIWGSAGGDVVRSCTVPCDKPLLLPLFNDVEWADNGACNSCDTCAVVAKQFVDTLQTLEVEIDGVPVQDLGNFREKSPVCFDFTLPGPDPANNLLNLPPKKYDDAFSDGFWLMLKPLSPGKHTIKVKVESPAFKANSILELTTEVGIVDPHGTVGPKTLGEWSAEWWRRAISIPVNRNPIVDPDGRFCHEGQEEEGPFFLWGNFGNLPPNPPLTTRTCSVPCGRPIFFPVVNDFEWIPDSPCNDCASCFAVAKANINNIAALACDIDGTAVADLGNHREVPPDCFPFEAPGPTPPDNIWNIRPGKFDVSTSDGFWLMLEPLCPGVHRIHFEAVLGNPVNPNFALNIVYYLSVEPCATVRKDLLRRGDVDASGPPIDISDAVGILNYLFLGAGTPRCLEAADIDDSGEVDISDAVNHLGYQFLGGAPPADPGPFNCGADPVPPFLGCDARCE